MEASGRFPVILLFRRFPQCIPTNGYSSLWFSQKNVWAKNNFFINLQRFSVKKVDKHGRKRLARLVQRSVTTLIIHVLLQEEQSIEMVGTMENCYYGKALSNALLPNTLKSGSFKFSQGIKQR